MILSEEWDAACRAVIGKESAMCWGDEAEVNSLEAFLLFISLPFTKWTQENQNSMTTVGQKGKMFKKNFFF